MDRAVLTPRGSARSCFARLDLNPAVMDIAVAGGMRCWRSRDSEARVVGGSRNADRNDRLREIEMVHGSLCAR